MPCIDSFGSAMICNGEEEKLIVFGGFNESKYEYSNTVYEYNVKENKWTILHQGGAGKDIPIPRSGCAACSDG